MIEITQTNQADPITIVDDAIDKEVAKYLDRASHILKGYSAFKEIKDTAQLAVFMSTMVEVAKMIRDEMNS